MNIWSVGKNTKRFLSILLVMAVVLMSFPLSVFAGGADIRLWTEAVTEEPVSGYVTDEEGNVSISTPQGLAWLISVVNGFNGETSNSFVDKTVTLTADIDLGAYLWTPIGNTNYYPFRGTFEGGNHKISGMNVNLASTGGGELSGGLFGWLVNTGSEGGGVIQNVSVSGEVTSNGNDDNYAGGIVGRNEGGTVTNCSFEGKVTAHGDGNNRAGGIAGDSQGGVVSVCSVKGYVTASGDNAISFTGNYAGSIVGNSFAAKVSDCSFEGDVTASGNCQNIAGGIVGSSHESEVSNCRSAGNITARDGKDVVGYGSSNIAGGVVGSFQTGKVTNCSFEGEATATRSKDNIAGGIAGYSHTSNVSNCYNIGTVSASKGENSNNAGGISGDGFQVTVSNCYNIGPVSASGGGYNYAGGIAGNNSENVVNCYWLDSIATAGIGGGNINPINCRSFTAAQGRGTSKDFTYEIMDIGEGQGVKTGTLLDALNEWVVSIKNNSNANNSSVDFLHWSQAHISYNQGYPVLGDAPQAPAPDPVPSLTVPIRGGGQSISTPVSTSGTTVTIRVPYLPSLENVASAAAEAKESVLIDLSSLNDSYDTALIQQSILRTVTESAALGLALVMPDGKQVNFDQAALSFFEKIGSGDLKLSVRTVAADEISREQRNIIGSAPVYELSVFVGEKKVTDFGGGLAEVTIPVVGEPVADPVVWRMDFDAKGEVDLKALPCSYDAGTNSYGFETTGFSLYVIGDYPFVDTADSAWYYEDTVFTYGRGLFQGTTRTTFAPLQDMKRCQLVTVLWRLEGKPQASGKGFSDVAGGEYFADALAWASANGIILGYENGDFGPYDSITRQQFALVMYRYAKYKGYDVEKGAGFDLAAFEDEDDVSGFALGAVRWLCGNDVIRGNSGRILPHKSASRAEVAAMLRRFNESVVGP